MPNADLCLMLHEFKFGHNASKTSANIHDNAQPYSKNDDFRKTYRHGI